MTNKPAPLDKRRKRIVAQLATEARQSVRINLPLHGHFLMKTGEEFPCKIEDISPGGLMVKSSCAPQEGERVILRVDELGRLEGDVVRRCKDSFAITLHTTKRKKDKLADDLTWQINKERLGLSDERSAKRTKRKNQVYVQSRDGIRFLAKSIDLSITGMAIETTEKIKSGEHVRVGRLDGVVTRQLKDGFAIRFDPPSAKLAKEIR